MSRNVSVHFREDVDESLRITAITGPLSSQFVQSLLSGTNPGPIVPTALLSAPTVLPIDDPTVTSAPTPSPSFSPSSRPTKFPTKAPTKFPTKKPSSYPTKKPALAPHKADKATK